MMMYRAVPILLVLTSMWACGEAGSEDSVPDASSDSGMAPHDDRDAGSRDGGDRRGVGVAFDGSVPDDGDEQTDGGVASDASEPNDVGTSADSGTVSDAGVTSDAGIVFCATPSAPFPVGFYDVSHTRNFCTTSPLYNCVPDADCTLTQDPVELEVLSTPHQTLQFDMNPTEWSYPYSELNRQTNGSEITMVVFASDCLPITFSEGYGNATLDTAAQSLVATFECRENGGFSCGSVPEIRVSHEVAGAYRCQASTTVCVRGAIVTCDANGTVTSSVSCGAPCAP